MDRRARRRRSRARSGPSVSASAVTGRSMASVAPWDYSRSRRQRWLPSAFADRAAGPAGG
jgi:hypothetical protein